MIVLRHADEWTIEPYLFSHFTWVDVEEIEVIHVDSINSVLNFIEENLGQHINLDLLAARSILSKYHFHRIFTALVGEKPMKYVQQRRLANAAHDLLNSNRRIIDIAFDYGFGSHASFIRAFKKKYSLTPSEFRNVRPNIQFQGKSMISPIDLRLSHGTAKLNPLIFHEQAFSVAGLKYSGHDTSEISRLWDNLWHIAKSKKLNNYIQKYYGICFHDFDKRNNEVFDYYAGIVIHPSTMIPEGFQRIDIPDNEYAVFAHQGLIEKIEMTYDQIYGNWLSQSDYLPTLDLDIIVVDHRFSNQGKKNEVDILIPVTKKSKN